MSDEDFLSLEEQWEAADRARRQKQQRKEQENAERQRQEAEAADEGDRRGPREEIEGLDVETRKKIYDFINEVPGCHLREVHRRVALPLGTVEYHVKWLVDNEAIIVKESGGYSRYYPMGKMGGEDRHIVGLLRQDIPRRIVIHLLLHPRATFKEVVEKAATGVGPSTVSFHMNKLVKGGIVRRTKAGRISTFLVLNRDTVAKNLISLRRGFLDDLVDKFVSSWVDLGPPPEGGQEPLNPPEGGQRDRRSQEDEDERGDLLVWTPVYRTTPVVPFARVGSVLLRMWTPPAAGGMTGRDPWDAAATSWSGPGAGFAGMSAGAAVC